MPQGYRAYKAPEGATSAATYGTVDIGGSTDDVFAQVIITGVATVALDASLDKTDWVQVAGGITASTIWEMDARIPYYRARVTSYSSGTVTVSWGPGEGRLGELQNVSGPITIVGGGPQ